MPSSERSVYLAGPVQHAEDGGHGWRDLVKAEHTDFDWIDPLDKYDVPADGVEVIYSDEYIDDGENVSSGAIVQDDKQMVRESSAVLVGWDDVPSCGTPMEVLYAYWLDIPVVVWYQGERLSPWMYHHATRITESLDDAVGHLNVLLNTGGNR